MQSVSSRIWTRVAESISYDDNHYTPGNFSVRLRTDWEDMDCCWSVIDPKKSDLPV